MKTTGNNDRRLELHSWQRQPQIKNPALHRIRNLTGELKAIQAQMHIDLADSLSNKQTARFLEDPSAVQVINDFKAEMDQLRRILWFYIEQPASQAGPCVEQEQQESSLQRVNELMRALSPKPALTGEAPAKRPASFFEKLDVVMDTYMQEKKPVLRAKAAKAGH